MVWKYIAVLPIEKEGESVSSGVSIRYETKKKKRRLTQNEHPKSSQPKSKQPGDLVRPREIVDSSFEEDHDGGESLIHEEEGREGEEEDL